MKLKKNLSIFLIIMFIVTSCNITKASSIDYEGQALQQQEFNNIVLFVDFDDSIGNFMTSDRRSAIIDMYNGKSVKALSNYISSVSNGKVQVNNYFPQDKDGVITPYRLSKARSQYNNSTEYEMIKEIVSNISVDSTIPLDGNNDGQVDNVTFIFLGGSIGITDVFWPHKHNHQSGATINGKTVNTYNVHNEESIFKDSFSGGKGVIAHEFLHSLGLPDLYRGSGSAVPVGRWDIMGQVHSSFLQYPLTYLRKDWVTMDTVKTSGTYTLNLATSKEGTQGIIIKTPLSEKEFLWWSIEKKEAPMQTS